MISKCVFLKRKSKIGKRKLIVQILNICLCSYSPKGETALSICLLIKMFIRINFKHLSRNNNNDGSQNSLSPYNISQCLLSGKFLLSHLIILRSSFYYYYSYWSLSNEGPKKQLVQCHIASKWKSQDSNLDCLTEGPYLNYTASQEGL